MIYDTESNILSVLRKTGDTNFVIDLLEENRQYVERIAHKFLYTECKGYTYSENITFLSYIIVLISEYLGCYYHDTVDNLKDILPVLINIIEKANIIKEERPQMMIDRGQFIDKVIIYSWTLHKKQESCKGDYTTLFNQASKILTK